MGAGTRLCSDLFEVGGQLFRLEVYPAGLNGGTHKYISLFLTTPGTARPSHLLYELSLLDRSQSKPRHITESRTAHAPSQSDAAAILAPHAGVVAGFPKFIKANFLHRNARRFLPGDTLTLRATLRLLTGRSSFPVASAAQPQLFSLQPSVAHAHAQLTPLPGPQPAPAQACCTPLPRPAYYGDPTAAATAGILTSPLYVHPACCRCGCGYYAGPQREAALLHQQQALLPYAPSPLQLQQQQLGGLAVVPFPALAPGPSLLLPAHLSYSAVVPQLAMSG